MQEKTAKVEFSGADSMLLKACLRVLPGIVPMRGLESSIKSMFDCFGHFVHEKKIVPEIGEPPRILGVPLKEHSLLPLQRNTTIAVLSGTVHSAQCTL